MTVGGQVVWGRGNPLGMQWESMFRNHQAMDVRGGFICDFSLRLPRALLHLRCACKIVP